MHLVWWLPVTLVRVAAALLTGRVDAVVAGDAIVATALRPVLWIRSVPNVTFVMGLDLTWRPGWYQALIRWGLRGWAMVAAISTATAKEAAVRIGRADRVEVFPLGVVVPTSRMERAEARRTVCQRWGVDADRLFVTTLGRVVKRKGAAWFTEFVMPHLPRAVYLVAGTGPEVDRVRSVAERCGIADRVILTGRVTDDEREALLSGSDVFVQPNVVVPGDMEGFGLVVAEAAVRDTPVVASGIEGIVDAIQDGQTGFLLPSADAQSWIHRLNELDSPRLRAELGARFGQRARQVYSREEMARRLAELMDKVHG
jgi:phosphatidylinositol alpha-1,6-mannosyltransferase